MPGVVARADGSHREIACRGSRNGTGVDPRSRALVTCVGGVLGRERTRRPWVDDHPPAVASEIVRKLAGQSEPTRSEPARLDNDRGSKSLS